MIVKLRMSGATCLCGTVCPLSVCTAAEVLPELGDNAFIAMKVQSLLEPVAFTIQVR